MTRRKDKDTAEGLRERLRKVTAELDELEERYQALGRAGARALTTLAAALAAAGAGQGVVKALRRLEAVAQASQLEPSELEEAVEELKTALLREPLSRPAAGGAGWEMVVEMLEALRLGDREFDPLLERATNELRQLVARGETRAVGKLVAGVVEAFKRAFARQRQEVEAALREIVAEVVRTEAELLKGFSSAHEQILQAGRDYDASLERSVGQLLKDIAEAQDLSTLKAKAIQTIRAMRDDLRARRQRELEAQQQAEQELKRLRRALAEVKERMRRVENLSRRLSEQALRCPLTGLYNKRAFDRLLSETLSRESDHPVSLIIFDVDRFKEVNDTYGHRAGDKALKAIAKAAKAALRPQDMLFRYAGDEFAIILPKTLINDATTVAERVRRAAEAIRFTYAGKDELRLTLSMGVAQAREGELAHQLFERADQALYEAKNQGRNRVVAAD